MPSNELRRSRSRSQHTCIGCTEVVEQRRAKRAARDGPQPWIIQKLTVGVVLCLVGYTVYVYVVRFCVPMITKKPNSIGGRTMGIAFLAVFSVLFLMFGWTYLKVILTPPGYAKDYISKTPPPMQQPQPYSRSVHSDDSIGGTPYNSIASRSRSQPSLDISFSGPIQSNSQSRSPPISHRNTHDTNMSMTQVIPSREAKPPGNGHAGNLSHSTADTKKPPHRLPAAPIVPSSGGSSSGLPPPLYSRRPPTHPVLSAEYRYCTREGFVKPMRAHHCRVCGTCVLKYDHHCPWIGQCVGAFNHKFFVNFLQWSTIFTVFIFTTLIIRNVRAATSSTTTIIDPEQVVIIALSGVFTLFTLALFVSHIHLILLNASTVEHLGMQRMRDRERRVLRQMSTCPIACSSGPRQPPEAYGLTESGGHSPFKYLTARRKILRQWDIEWGSIDTEGNIWWLGSKRANWEATMGKKMLGWILPIGRSLGDGLTYPTNPRFDRDGRWRRRVEWPAGLR